MLHIYLAGPLFTEADRDWMRSFKALILKTAARIGVAVEVIWPWELFKPGEIEQLGELAGREIFERCRTVLDRTDILIALLDGSMVDDGTAWEIGYFYRGRLDQVHSIIGIRTDLRNAGETPGAKVNAMVEYACDQIAITQDEAIKYLTHAILCLKS